MKANILIVEDDPMVQFIHRSYLERLAVLSEFFGGNSGRSARNAAKRNH